MASESDSELIEQQRLRALYELDVLDTPPEPELDELALLASRLCGTPNALISLIDKDRLWVKACIGTQVTQFSREIAFSHYAIQQDGLFVVEDASGDPRFRDNPLVCGVPGIRFYAGMPLVTREGHRLGTLCVIDYHPRRLTDEQAEGLRILARQTSQRLEMRKALSAYEHAQRELVFQKHALDQHAIVAVIDPVGRITYVNDRFCAVSQYDRTELIGREHRSLCSDAHSNSFFTEMRETLARAEVWRGQLCNRGKNGQLYWLEATIVPFTDANRRITRYIAICTDITDRKNAEQRIERLTSEDALTGLANRELLTDRIEQCIHRARREPGFQFAVMFIDLDRFKVVNDSLGHAAGDKMLLAMAQRFANAVRAGDLVAPGVHQAIGRFGGDEFCLLLEDLRDPADALRIGNRLLQIIAAPILFDGHEITTTASIGVVCSDTSHRGARDMLRDADVAMHRAKAEGKNRCELFDPTMHDAAMRRLQVETDLRHALARNEMLLHFQPIVSLKTRRLEAFETLIRWRRGGVMIGPSDFISIAEDTGLIYDIGRWVLDRAAMQLDRWSRRMPSLCMAVNLSRRQLTDPQLVPQIESLLRRHHFAPRQLRLELTESMIMESGPSCSKTLADLRALGVQLAMDDFGTGHSSLSCLHRYPMNVLKIDRSFISDLAIRHSASPVVHAVINLAHSLGMTVVAEGLETVEQVAFLQTIRCDSAQGYFFDRPLDAHTAEQRIDACLRGASLMAAG